MANITVYIQSNEDLRYSPGPAVQQGDTVTFQLVNIPGKVEVDFEDGRSCLTPPGPITLNGGNLLTSSAQETVSLTAPRGQYPFTVQIFGDQDQEARRKGGEHETKTGGLDVTTDPRDEKPDRK